MFCLSERNEFFFLLPGGGGCYLLLLGVRYCHAKSAGGLYLEEQSFSWWWSIKSSGRTVVLQTTTAGHKRWLHKPQPWKLTEAGWKLSGDSVRLSAEVSPEKEGFCVRYITIKWIFIWSWNRVFRFMCFQGGMWIYAATGRNITAAAAALNINRYLHYGVLFLRVQIYILNIKQQSLRALHTLIYAILEKVIHMCLNVVVGINLTIIT